MEIGCQGVLKFKTFGNHCTRCYFPCETVYFAAWATRIKKLLNTAFPLIASYV